MRGVWLALCSIGALASCSGSDEGASSAASVPNMAPIAAPSAPAALPAPNAAPASTVEGAAPSSNGDEGDETTTVEALNPTIVVFDDPDSPFSTSDVYDATREIVRFDAEQQTMVSAATGDAVSGWMTNGNELGPYGSFRVRFGSEGGQRRAYFTETGSGTICNLVLGGPGMLDIFATSELPPMN
jgi:hypothetical protein